MATLEEIAELSGFSRSTVSRVINGEPHVKETTRQKVMEIIRQTNYRPNVVARSLAAGRSRILGFIVPAGAATAFSDPFFPTLMGGMASACNAHDYALMFWLAELEDEERMIGRVVRNRGLLDGLVISSMHLPETILDEVLDSGLPFVLIGKHTAEVATHYVDVENRSGALEAVAHLLQLGRERVATITGPMTTLSAQDRYAGYRGALTSHGHTVVPQLVVSGDYSEASGYFGMQALLAASPDAVFVANDLMALGALRALKEAGFEVPRDVAIVGFDDAAAAALADPPLTTVRQPTERLGAVATDILIDVLEGGASAFIQTVLATELVIRASCGALT